MSVGVGLVVLVVSWRTRVASPVASPSTATGTQDTTTVTHQGATVTFWAFSKWLATWAPPPTTRLISADQPA